MQDTNFTDSGVYLCNMECTHTPGNLFCWGKYNLFARIIPKDKDNKTPYYNSGMLSGLTKCCCISHTKHLSLQTSTSYYYSIFLMAVSTSVHKTCITLTSSLYVCIRHMMICMTAHIEKYLRTKTV